MGCGASLRRVSDASETGPLCRPDYTAISGLPSGCGTPNYQTGKVDESPNDGKLQGRSKGVQWHTLDQQTTVDPSTSECNAAHALLMSCYVEALVDMNRAPSGPDVSTSARRPHVEQIN
mmetsp:Transcript_36607/g.97629  ORF Transcript_36607/g.97629 Transcript_36607/m.97629 type:complete len:119 (-) Transcript_36607:194-550(-)